MNKSESIEGRQGRGIRNKITRDIKGLDGPGGCGLGEVMDFY